MGIAKYFKTAFANAGTKTTIPEVTQPDGSVNYSDGYGVNYQLAKTNPLSLNIERDKANELYYEVTLALQYLQQNSAPEFISTADNGGSPYSYRKGTRVRYETTGLVYESMIDANTALPSDATRWRIVTDYVPVWTAQANYTVPGLVFGSDGVLYRAILASGPAGAGAKDPTSQPTYWTAVGTSSQRFALAALTASVAGNALTVNIPAMSLDFRSSTLNNGTPSTLTTGALAITAPSGASLGAVSGQQATLAVLEYNNAGTAVAGLVNVTGGANLDETTLVSPTNIGAGSTSATTFYSASTVAANSPFRVVGYIQITEAAAGVYATAPSLVQGIGGQAAGAMASIGYGQLWAIQTRTIGTTYYNTTGKPIMVSVYDVPGSNVTGYETASISVNGVLVEQNTQFQNAEVNACGVQAIVPPGAAYICSITGSFGAMRVVELR